MFPIMNVERDLFEMSPEAEAAADAKALADIAAGKGVPHEKVVAWLKTWGTPQEGPPPTEWFE
jgi:predicted transcriptional regulator